MKDNARLPQNLEKAAIPAQVVLNARSPLVALRHRLGASATPTWFVESGERYSGSPALDEVRRILDSVSSSDR